MKLKDLHPNVKTHKCGDCGCMIRVPHDEFLNKTLKCKQCEDGALFPLDLKEQDNAWRKQGG